jgi:hypothetical protein
MNGSIDMPFGEEYTGTSVVTDNVEDSVSSLFREIGKTLQDVTMQGISTVGATVKTTLANKIINSPEGQAQVAAYKMEYLMKYLPWIILAAVSVFVGGRMIRS